MSNSHQHATSQYSPWKAQELLLREAFQTGEVRPRYIKKYSLFFSSRSGKGFNPPTHINLSCQTLTSITEQSMESPTTSITRGFSNRLSKVAICYKVYPLFFCSRSGKGFSPPTPTYTHKFPSNLILYNFSHSHVIYIASVYSSSTFY